MVQKPLQLLERSLPPSKHLVFGHVMAAFCNPYADTFHLEFGAFQNHIDQPHRKAEIARLLHQLAVFRRSEEHTSELQSLMRSSYAVFCLKKKINLNDLTNYNK